MRPTARTWHGTGASLRKAQMRAHLVVIDLIRMKQMAQIPFAKYDHVVKTVTSDRADEPFRMAVLPVSIANRILLTTYKSHAASLGVPKTKSSNICGRVHLRIGR